MKKDDNPRPVPDNNTAAKGGCYPHWPAVEMPREFVSDLLDATDALARHGYSVAVTEGSTILGVGNLIVPNVKMWPHCCGEVVGHLVVDDAGDFMLVPAEKAEVLAPQGNLLANTKKGLQ